MPGIAGLLPLLLWGGGGVINKDLSKQADPYSTYRLGEKSLGHWRGPDGQGGKTEDRLKTHRLSAAE